MLLLRVEIHLFSLIYYNSSLHVMWLLRFDIRLREWWNVADR